MPENVLVFCFVFLARVGYNHLSLYLVTWTDVWRIAALKTDQMMTLGHFRKHTGVLQQTATATRLAVLNSSNFKTCCKCEALELIMLGCFENLSNDRR